MSSNLSKDSKLLHLVTYVLILLREGKVEGCVLVGSDKLAIFGGFLAYFHYLEWIVRVKKLNYGKEEPKESEPPE